MAIADRQSFATTLSPAYDLERVRADFPILAREIHGHPLVYLDNAASTQKPREVIEALSSFYETSYANVERGVHTLSMSATEAREAPLPVVDRFRDDGCGVRELEAAGALVVQGNTDIAVADFDYAAAFPWFAEGVPDAFRAAAEWAHETIGPEVRGVGEHSYPAHD